MAVSLIAEFLAAVRRGEVVAGNGGPSAGTLGDGMAPLRAADPEAITAEAYNQEILDPEVTPWAEGLALVRAGLAAGGNQHA